MTFNPGDPYYLWNFQLQTVAAWQAANVPVIGPGLLQSFNKRLLEMGPRAFTTDGADVGFDYRLPAASIGSFDVGMQGTWIRSYRMLYQNPGQLGFLVTDRSSHPTTCRRRTTTRRGTAHSCLA